MIQLFLKSVIFYNVSRCGIARWFWNIERESFKTCFHHSCLCNISIYNFTYQCSSMFVLTFAYKYSGFLSTLTHHVLHSCYKIFNAKESWAFPLTLLNKRHIWDLRVVLPIFSFAMQLSSFFNEMIYHLYTYISPPQNDH